MAWHAIGRGIGRASHLGVKVARAAVIFSSCDSATESGRTNPTPRLRVGLQSTLGLSPDSSVAIDCQNVSPEPGAFDDTAGPARRVCARPFCERCPTSDRLWPKVRETITKPGFRSVTFGLFFIWRNRGSNDSPPASFVAVKGRDCAEGAGLQFVSLACRSPRRSTTSSRPRFRRRGGARSIGARSSNGGARLLSSSRGSAGTRVGRRCASPSERFRPAKRRRDQKQKHRSNRHRRERARRRG